MLGPLQTGLSCVSGPVSQASRAHGGLWSQVRQVPHLAHNHPGVESGSSGSHSPSSVPGALSCHRQNGQYGGGASHQSPGGSESRSLNRHVHQLLCMSQYDGEATSSGSQTEGHKADL